MARRTWIGLGVSVVGAAAAGGLDIRSGGPALLGGGLALAGAMALASYTALSGSARSDVSTPLYSVVSSFVCALELLVVCLLAGTPLTGFDSSTRWSLVGLLAVPQLLGLGSLNFVLGRAVARTVSVVLLRESPLAALVAWLLIGQRIDPLVVPGLLLIIVGVMVVVTSGHAEPLRCHRAAGTAKTRRDIRPTPHRARPRTPLSCGGTTS